MPLWVYWMLLSLWPLVAICIIDGMLVYSLVCHIPRIWSNYRWNTWHWWAMVVVLLAVGVGTTLVIQEPFSDWPHSMAAKPGAIAGLLVAGWALFGWVLATEREAHQDMIREESLEAHLQPF